MGAGYPVDKTRLDFWEWFLIATIKEMEHERDGQDGD